MHLNIKHTVTYGFELNIFNIIEQFIYSTIYITKLLAANVSLYNYITLIDCVFPGFLILSKGTHHSRKMGSAIFTPSEYHGLIC